MSSIAVVGGGIVGLSIAWRLAQRGHQISVFDRGTLGGEASWAGAGMLSPGGEVNADSELNLLAQESRALYSSFIRELEEISQTRIDFQECGALDLAYSPEEWDLLEDRATVQMRLGIRSKRTAPEQVRSFWPRVRTEGLYGALFYPGDALVNPREVVQALIGVCRQMNVLLFENCPVQGVVVANCGVVLSEKDVREFDSVVISAGAWSSSIHVEGIPALPFSEPVKGHLIGYRQPAQTCNTLLRRGHSYMLQRANGMLIAGASTERVGFDRQISHGRVQELREQANFLLPHLAETEPSEIWVGFRPGSESLHIGRWHSPRLYLAYGHYRNGILLAPGTARRVADEISASSGRPLRAPAAYPR